MQNNLPVLVLKGQILLPNCDIKVELEKEKYKNLLDISELFHNFKILVVQKENELEETNQIKNFPKIGVIAKITHKIELPNGKIRFILTGLSRAKVLEYLTNETNIESIITKIEIKEDNEDKIYIKKLKEELKKYIDIVPYVGNSISQVVENTTSLDVLTNIVPSILSIDRNRQFEYLNEISPKIRTEMALKDIYEEEESFNIEKELDAKVRKTLDESQREYILKEKLKEIKQELNEKSVKEDEISYLYEKLEELKANDKIKDRIKSEIRRLESLSMVSPEVSVVRNYIDWLLSLPWEEETIDNDNLKEARQILDDSHNGLENVKERIIEYLAVKQMKGNLKSPIICLAGPPGVGKTTLAISIAKAMNRKFVKMSVGGINDEAEIIGHRRTYLGSAPGRIIQSLKKAKTKNPVFLIDEIDKMTRDYKGDTASVLLEILDPEQNKYFSDNFIEEEFDLSKVVFITTANYVNQIPEALKDRLEIINLSGYTEYEKLEIAKKYLLPRICKEHGVNVSGIKIKDEVILKVIRSYTRESGVRELERKLATIIRKIVTEIVTKRIIINKFLIDEKKVEEYLGKEIYHFYGINKNNDYGIVNGLAYTNYGGDTEQLEVTSFTGTGRLILTGNVGKIMTESVQISLDYIKANAKSFKVNLDKINKLDIHIHIPEASVPKEGPSAGIAITTAILSMLKKKKISNKIALTGELTLKGNVLKIGGLKEKVIGASRNRIKTIFIPYDNIPDIEEIEDFIKKEIEFIPVKNYKEIYRRILEEDESEKEK